jgi:hypothetical protein
MIPLVSEILCYQQSNNSGWLQVDEGRKVLQDIRGIDNVDEELNDIKTACEQASCYIASILPSVFEKRATGGARDPGDTQESWNQRLKLDRRKSLTLNYS